MPFAVRPSAVRLAALAGFIAIFSVTSQAQPTLAFDQALRVAQDRSRQLVAQDAAASASRSLAHAAGQLPDPVFKTSLNSLPVSGPDRFSLTRDSFTMLSVGVVQELTRPDKLRARAARFEREAEAVEATRVLALANLRRDTATAWLDRYHQERMLGLLQAQRAEAALQIEAADTAYRSGRGTQAEVFAARSVVALLDDRSRQAERQVTTAKTRLARWVGDGAHQALGAPPALAVIGLDAGNITSRLAHHPEITVMAKQAAMASADVDIAQRNKRADWSVELTYSQRGPAYANMVSVNLAIPLQWDQKKRQDSELAAKLAVVDQLHAQREEVLRERLADVQSWLQEWHGNRERLLHYDSALIPLAAERTRAALAAYRGGTGGGSGALAAVLDARRVEIDTRMDRLRLEMETAGRWAQIEYGIPPGPDAAAQAGATTPTEQ